MKKLTIIMLLTLINASIGFATNCGTHPAQTDKFTPARDWIFSKAETSKDLFARDACVVKCYFKNFKTREEAVGQEFFGVPVDSILTNKHFTRTHLADGLIYNKTCYATPEGDPCHW